MSANQKKIIFPGLKPVLELLQDNPQQIEKIFLKKNLRSSEANLIMELCQKNGIRIEFLNSFELDRICSVPDRKTPVAHQGVIAELVSANMVNLQEMLLLITKSPLPLAIALDQIQDVGNLGAIARTAYAMGCAGLILPEHGSAPVGASAYRASAGALGLLPVAIVANLARALDDAEENGINIYGSGTASASTETAKTVSAFEFKWQFPSILVAGSENNGIRPGVAKRCSLFLHIPFARKFDSLNVSQACAMFIALCSTQANSRLAC